MSTYRNARTYHDASELGAQLRVTGQDAQPQNILVGFGKAGGPGGLICVGLRPDECQVAAGLYGDGEQAVVHSHRETARACSGPGGSARPGSRGGYSLTVTYPAPGGPD